ncbi:hypothetical protein DM02DRAFT_614774 [Periconia macrospinosa]|uniref:Cadmium resistance transporter n=1 Tax=Periconia macrospinosa TaxID=97972 RepID=A0A2V1DR49_9PLEO|nr:hypothetical protein DM02DRAFT_614774 [Periconia macrospinosa]
MNFGSAIGTACSSFIITNIDDIFVLVTFFAEASRSTTITPLKIVLGQYIGFSIIIGISMIGYGLAMVLPAAPIGFLGLLPIMLGVWKILELAFSNFDDEEEQAGEGGREGNTSKRASVKSVVKVAGITLMNGGDNLGTYTPLFSQAKGAEIAVYVVTYYIFLGLLCLVAFLIMKQKHILRIARKYAHFIIPFLYIGLGIFITVKSECYPWSVENIDENVASRPGRIIMGVVTMVLLLTAIVVMVWYQWRTRSAKRSIREATSDNDDTERTDDVVKRERNVA